MNFFMKMQIGFTRCESYYFYSNNKWITQNDQIKKLFKAFKKI